MYLSLQENIKYLVFSWKLLGICYFIAFTPISQPSYIRKGKCRPATPTAAPSRLGDPPWILKWARLESYGRRLISLIEKTIRIAFFFGKTNIFKILRLNKKK